MTSTTWTQAPADLLGLGGPDVRPAHGPGLCSGSAVRTAAPIAPAQGTGVSAAGTGARRRPVAPQAVVVTTNVFENTGTPLGIHSSRRPQS
jgi:hypothetical protein